ncbi:HEAT repeat-containing protein 6 isoform X2 [Calliopsis andreniformis]|uniref:HEAT repeat-containing protein 6 isoform X2 n=1 Tax=Calliopsis andreniformis TaxID=337506 RepID=UPI003FCD5B2A
MTSTYSDYSNDITKFTCITEKLLALTKTKSHETKLISNYLCDLNKLDYRFVSLLNDNVVDLLIQQLCVIIIPEDTALIRNICKLLYNLIQNNVKFQRQTYICSKEWILKVLESASPVVHNEILLTLKNMLLNEQDDNINHYAELLFRKNKLLNKFLNPRDTHWSEIQYHALGCIEGILLNKHYGTLITQEFICIIKEIILNILSSSQNLSDDKFYRAKILTSCLHILHIITVNKLLPHSTNFMGEILGVVQAFLFYGVKEYPPVKPQLLHPVAMNLPEQIHVIPNSKNLKNHKVKLKKQSTKKMTTEERNIMPEYRGINIYSSDSDASDTETMNSIYVDSKVRLEAVHLLQAVAENSQNREIFGFWPQIVATGSRNDARVLARSILKESVSKVKQNMLNILTELLTNAKPFLSHAEDDTNQVSFITFFGTVSLMIKELHFMLCLVLNDDNNVAVLTHALKCVVALIQSTPYARLQTGLATKLMRNCKPYISHKDPTVRVAALSTFEAIASCDPITPEIFAILAKQLTTSIELNQLHLNVPSTDSKEEKEEEENIEDAKLDIINEYDNKELKKADICFLIHTCLQNVSDKTTSTPVRLQSLKLISRMAFNTGSLVFSHTELVATILISAIQNSDTQVILHVCRTLEVMAGCLLKSDCDSNNVLIFWNIILEPMTLLLQHSQMVLREAACDCLGSINPIVFTQLSRQKAILIITVLFGAVHDEESAVRAAALRALGMLVTLPSLKDETGFLMDLADLVCFIADDKNLGVRIKGAWALANLCDCLSKEKNHEEVEPLPLEILLPKLYRVSIAASKDSDKIKCNAVRALGSIIYLCSNKRILIDTSLGIDALISCATLGNDMKDLIFPVLCKIICNSPNFKVRTNAAWALYSCNSYDKYVVTLWKSIILAFENSQHVPSYTEYSHRDALVQQLCLTLGHVAAYTEVSDLQNLWAEIGDHIDDISNYVKKFQETIVPEKIGDLVKAKFQLQKYAKSAPSTTERRIAQNLASIFERSNRYDNLDVTNVTS